MIRFLNPVMLWALPLALAPLLLRHRQPRDPVEVPFAAMRFLKLARRRPRHYILLTAIRIALLAGLIFAFARPYLSSLIPHPSSLAVLPPGNPYLTAALGKYTPTGNRTLDFDPTGEPQSGDLTIAPGPYFHPALQLIPSLHTVRVRHWVKLPVEPHTIIPLRLSNGDPFLTETDGHIRCAAALDPQWTDLPHHPNFLPLVQELTAYLRHLDTPALPHSDFSAALFLLVLVLILLESALAGFTRWKLIPLALLLALFLPVPRPSRTLTIADQTDSMKFHPPPPAADITLTGSTTDLGRALLALTNRACDRVILHTDAQHNTGPDPVWAAARLGKPVRIVPPPTGLRDISITHLASPDFAVTGQLIDVTATITSFTNQLLTVTLGSLTTNIPPGTHTFRVPAAPGLHLHVAPVPEEITTANNSRLVPVTIITRPHRIFLQAAAPDWEYRHVRHLLVADPLIELVDDPRQADEIIVTTNDTWRLRRFGDAAFAAYWQRPPPPTAPSPSTELYRLTPNHELIADIHRVTAGFDPRPSFDLRNSRLLLLLLITAWLAAWYRQRMLN